MRWRRSSQCHDSACVEVGFRKARRSADNGACVEVAPGVLVRDSKDPDGPRLATSTASFGAFLADIRTGRLDRGSDGQVP